MSARLACAVPYRELIESTNQHCQNLSALIIKLFQMVRLSGVVYGNLPKKN